jgi:tetratricopeptide (TPR) repeat protein
MKFLLTLIGIGCMFYSFAQTDSANHYAGLGKQAYNEKRFAVAEKNYVKALKYDSLNIPVLLDLADAYIQMKKYGNATIQNKAILKINPNHPKALESLAELCFMNRSWEEAIQYAKICLDKKIGTKMSYKLAKSYYSMEEYAQSTKYLQAASIEEPQNGEIPYIMANIWVEMNNAKKAIEAYNIALSLDSTNASWLYEFGMLHNDLGDAKKAVTYLEKSLQYGMKTDLSVMTTLGLAYISSGEFAKGEEMVQKVVAKKQMDKALYNDIGYAYYNIAKYDDAIRWWDEILRINKDDARTLYMIGIAFRKKGNEEKGNKLCDAAIALDPSLASLRKQMMPPQGMGL